jgi:hypothetical protein
MIEQLAVASWLAVISQYPTHSCSLNFLIVRVIIILQDVVWLQMWKTKIIFFVRKRFCTGCILHDWLCCSNIFGVFSMMQLQGVTILLMVCLVWGRERGRKKNCRNQCIRLMLVYIHALISAIFFPPFFFPSF